MFKKLAIALLLISNTATAAEEPTIVLPEGITCSSLFWQDSGRINPNRLSNHQKCILATTQGETNSGAMGDLLWLRIDGEYFSMSKRKLWVMSQDEDLAKQMAKTEFIKQWKEWKKNGNN